MSEKLPEAWLRGPMAGVDPRLQPAAHALQQSREEIEKAVPELTHAELWERPGGAAPLGFHLRHIAGAIDRLLTYAVGQQLSPEQRQALAAEREQAPPEVTRDALVQEALIAIDRALTVIRAADPSTLHDARAVGRAALPSSVFGLLGHIAEHTTRHTGQIIVTAKVVRAR